MQISSNSRQLNIYWGSLHVWIYGYYLIFFIGKHLFIFAKSIHSIHSRKHLIVFFKKYLSAFNIFAELLSPDFFDRITYTFWLIFFIMFKKRLKYHYFYINDVIISLLLLGDDFHGIKFPDFIEVSWKMHRFSLKRPTSYWNLLSIYSFYYVHLMDIIDAVY